MRHMVCLVTISLPLQIPLVLTVGYFTAILRKSINKAEIAFLVIPP